MRVAVSEAIRDIALGLVKHKLERRMKEKGAGSYTSPHEIVGWLKEEFEEFVVEARHADKYSPGKANERLIGELADIAVAAIFGIASITAGGLERY